MARIINPGRASLALLTGHVVPREGSLITTNEVIRENGATLTGLALSGQITVEMDPEPDGEGDMTPAPIIEPTPEAKALAATSALLAAAAAETDDLTPKPSRASKAGA